LARALPRGPSSETTSTFIAPQPVSLAFEEMPLSIPLSGEAPLRIHVADQDNILVRPLSGSWNVSLKLSGNAEAIQLEPDRVVLSWQTPMREVFLRMIGMPVNEELLVYARTEDGSLRTAEKNLGFESNVGQIKLIMPLLVIRGAPTDVKAQFLFKGQEHEAASEFQRKVSFFSDNGNFEPEEKRVEKGATYAASVFVAHQSGQANLRIATSGVDVVQHQVLIVVALGLLCRLP
jgi:hypothetical protein